MKCAKCGHEIAPDAPRCEYCADHDSGENSDPNFIDPVPETERRERRTVCPNCGSHQIFAVTRGYDPGCGCLGLLLFSWVGLLLGLLGAGGVDMVCARCGYRWPAGSGGRGGIGCCGLLLIIVVAAIIIKLFS